MPLPSSSAQQALTVLGRRLRNLRREAALTGEELAQRIGWHPSKVSRIELARRPPSVADIRAWCRGCDAPDQADDLAASLVAIEGMFVDWRQVHRTGLKQSNESLLPLWDRTHQFRIYSSQLIPGPLQTRAYIAELLSSFMGRYGLPNDVEEAVQVRVDKQHIIHEGNRRIAVVLEESVLRSRISNAEVMAGQLGHLLTASTLPAVSLGIIPFTAERRGLWPQEMFFMFDEAEVTVELVSGHLTVTRPHEIAQYAEVFKDLSALAVFGKGARRLITDALAELGG